MKKCIKTVNKINELLQKFEMAVACVALAVLFLVMIANAFMRYTFSKAILWSDELNGFLFVWFSFMSAAYIMGNDEHIRITLLIDAFNKVVKYILRMLTDVVMIYFLVIFIKPIFKCMSVMTFSGIMRIPLEYVYVIMPITMILMAIHIVFNMFRDTVAFFKPELLEEEGGNEQ